MRNFMWLYLLLVNYPHVCFCGAYLSLNIVEYSGTSELQYTDTMGPRLFVRNRGYPLYRSICLYMAQHYKARARHAQAQCIAQFALLRAREMHTLITLKFCFLAGIINCDINIFLDCKLPQSHKPDPHTPKHFNVNTLCTYPKHF